MAAFAPDIIFQIGPLPITNTVIHTLIVDGLLIGTALYLSKRISLRPKGLQSLIEPVVESIYNLTESIASSKKATRMIFPYVMTFFLFIFICNITSLFPGVGSIGFYNQGSEDTHATVVARTYAEEPENHDEETSNEHAGEEHSSFTPLIRGATSDINLTFALAIISVVATHVMSVKLTGFNDYISRWLSFNLIYLYVGLLEFVAEFTKIISLSFRLFGNIFAGEVALHTISSLFAFIAPLPFLLLESIVSIVQALVFAILTLVFMAVLTTPHHSHEKH